MIRTICYIIFLFSSILPCRAIPYYFNHYQVKHGLSNNSIICSAQDQDGFIWFGTKDGLNRFDGYQFKNFFHQSGVEGSLGSNFIHSLLVRKSNEIWVGTDQGIYIYDTKKERFSSFAENTNGETLQIKEDKNEHVWFVSNNKIYQYDNENKKLNTKYSNKWKTAIYAFGIDQNNEVWIGTDNIIYNLATDESYEIPDDDSKIGRMERFFVDKNNNIWIGTSKMGIYLWDRKTKKIQHIIQGPLDKPLYIRDIVEVEENKVWIATESGLIIYDTSNHTSEHIAHETDNSWSLADNALYTILKDNQGGIWIGSFFGGVNYYHPRHNFFEKIFPRQSANSIKGHAVREIIEDKNNNIWIGTEDQGLTYWNPKKNLFKNFDHLAQTNIHGLLISGDSLFVGTFFQGMNVFDLKTKKKIQHHATSNTLNLQDIFIYHMYKTSDGKILMATSPGLYQFIPRKDSFIPFKPAPDNFFYTSIYEDDKKNLWLTTWRDGLIKIDHKDQSSKRYIHQVDDKSSINSNRGTKVFQDSHGQIWIATEGGLAIYNENSDNFERITTADGLPSNLILAIQQDDFDNLWISTTKGLVKMEIPTRKMETYNLEHGLLDLQFNYNSAYKDSKGMLYFGSSKGLIRFDPANITNRYKTDQTTPIYITGFQVNQHEIPIQDDKDGVLSKSILYTDKIELEHDESSFSIDFVALNFASANSTSYLYRLNGLDTAWSFLRNNAKVNFTKVPPGNYKFEVMAADPNQTPISHIKTLKITVHPPIWASTPAYTLYTILFLLGIGLLLRYYDQKVKEKNRRRIQLIKEHKEKELYKAKMDFFTQVTHEIKTPLTLIKAPLEKILNGTDHNKTEKWLNTIHQNTEKLLYMTDNILDFRKIESKQFSLNLKENNIAKLIQSCLQDFAPLLETKEQKIKTSIDSTIHAKIDIETIYKILSNLISNAIKYADNKIYIHLYRSEDAERFCIEIKNDGVVFDEMEAAQLFKPFQRSSSHYRVKGSGLGLALSYSFASLHGGKLYYKKDEKNLNVFVLEIPFL